MDPCKEAIENFKAIIPSYLSGLHYINKTDEHSLDCVFNNPDVTAVFVCSTTGSHYSISKRAIESGNSSALEFYLPKQAKPCFVKSR